MNPSPSENIYVIGYPKSGNTWACKLIGNALKMPLREDNKTHSEFNKRHKLRADKANKLVVKSHLIPNNFYRTETSRPFRIVYISRDVRDVAVSSFFYWMRFLNYKNGIEYRLVNNKLFNGYFTKRKSKEYLTEFASKNSSEFQYEDWSEHHSLWSGEEHTNNIKIVKVKYEDLLDNTQVQLLRILQELEIDIDSYDPDLSKVIEDESFKVLKSKYRLKGDTVNSNFLRSGKSGDWKNYFDNTLTKLYLDRYGFWLNKLDYRF